MGDSSPASLTLEPIDPTLMETSFEEKLSEEHAKAIWHGSIQFLRGSLKVKFDESKGFNDGDIFEYSMELKDSICEENELGDILCKN